MRLLVVEDDKEVSQFLSKGLKEAGHTVDVAFNGKDGLFMATTETYDAIIVDRMLPHVDGLTIVRTLRASSIAVPVLVLSALGEVGDRVTGLKAGADDYVVKPFAITEVLARLEALMRRNRGELKDDRMLQVADLQIDRLKREVSRAGKTIDLQPREFRLLEYLMQHTDQVVTRTMLLEHVWEYHFDPQTNVIDVHISRLRTKIDRDFSPPLIHTVRGAGYRLAVQ